MRPAAFVFDAVVPGLFWALSAIAAMARQNNAVKLIKALGEMTDRFFRFLGIDSHRVNPGFPFNR
jgi:hypothetical protein